MKRVSLVALMTAMSATSSYAQMSNDGLTQGGLGLRGSDAALSASPRQQPNMQPSAPSIGAYPQSPQAASQTADATPAAGWPSASAPYKGYGIGGGTLQLGITAVTFYDDNVFAGNARRFSDTTFAARPEFAWMTQGAGYGLGIDGFVEARRNVQFESENQVNGSIGANFTVMPDSDTQVVGNARYIRAHLARGTSETIGPGGALLSTIFNNPIAYDQGIASVALNKRYDRWWTSVGLAGVAVNYENPTVTGALIDLSYANGRISVINGRLGYVVAPQTSVFVEAAGNNRDWDVNIFDSNGYRVVGGVLFEQGPNARLRGELWAGYMNQLYSGASFQNVSSWTYGASLAFLFTDQLTGVIEGKREAKESALSLAFISPGVIGASAATCSFSPGATCVSAIESTVSGRLEYRIIPTVSLGAGASFAVDDYLGPAAGGRTDRTLSPTASLKYFPNDRVVFGFDYRRINFDPSGGQTVGVSAISYYRDVYLLSMNGKF